MNARAAKRIRRLAAEHEDRKNPQLIPRLKRQHYAKAERGEAPVIWLEEPRDGRRPQAETDFQRSKYVPGKPYGMSRAFLRTGGPDKSAMWKRLVTQEWQRMRRLKKKETKT